MKRRPSSAPPFASMRSQRAMSFGVDAIAPAGAATASPGVTGRAFHAPPSHAYPIAPSLPSRYADARLAAIPSGAKILVSMTFSHVVLYALATASPAAVTIALEY